MKKFQFSTTRKLLISLLVTVLLFMSAHLVLTSGLKVDVFTTTVETASGHEIAVRVYKPKSATADNKAPAVAFMHGMSTTKEAYAQYAIELSRRGFVVATPDMMNHGDSEIAGVETFFGDPGAEGYGLYSAVKLIAGFDYVDVQQIGVAGHSMGGNALNISIFGDNFSPQPLISAAYLLSSDPMLRDFGGQPVEIYGNRSVGLFYSTFDHVYFKGHNAQGEPLLTPDYLNSMEAKTFVTGGDEALMGAIDTVKTDFDYTANGGLRRIHQEDVIHPYAQGGNKAINQTVDFFTEVFNAPKEIKSNFVIADFYQVLSVLSLFSMLVAGYYILNVLLETKAFVSLKSDKKNTIRENTNPENKKWAIITTLINVAFAFLSITAIYKLGFGYFALTWLPQQVSNIFALWSLINGLFMLLVMFVTYQLVGKKQGLKLSDWGVTIGLADFVKSIALALLTFAAMMTLTYIAGFIFQMDMRMYLWGIRQIPFNKLYLLLIYAPFFIIFAVSVSLSINGMNYVKFSKEKEWINTVIIAILNMIPPLFITVLGYSLFKKTGVQPNIFGSDYTFTNMINAIPAYPIAVIYIRILNKHTKNPYIPGIIVGLLFAFFQVASLFTMHAYLFM